MSESRRPGADWDRQPCLDLLMSTEPSLPLWEAQSTEDLRSAVVARLAARRFTTNQHARLVNWTIRALGQ